MRNKAATALLLSVALCACDRQSGTGEAEGAAATPAPSAQRSGADAGAAVLQSTGTPVAKLAFTIDTRPVAGQPFTVKLEASAAAPVPQLQLLASASGLIVAPETATLAIGKADTPATHELIVTAPQPVLTELIVRLKAEGSPEAVYAIPVLVLAPGS